MGMLDTKNHCFWYNFVCQKPTEKINVLPLTFTTSKRNWASVALWVPISSCFTCFIWRVNSTWRHKMSRWHLISPANQIILSPTNLSLFGTKWIVSFALNHLPPHQRKIIPCHPSLWFHKVHQLTNHIAGGPSRDNLISQSVHGKKVYMSAMSTNMRHGMHLPKCPIHQYVDRNA